MVRKWMVEIDNTKHKVEAIYGEFFSYGSGKVLVDNKVIEEWGPSAWGMIPKEKTFEIAGKQATLKRTGFFIFNMELSVPEASKVIRTQ